MFCQGKGCSRVNCRDWECSESKRHLTEMECVTRCVGSSYYREGCGDEYCTDCRVKMLDRKNWIDCCSSCKEKVAPALAAQNKRLREEIEKLREE